ncbi:MAG: PcfJ domain-containing protein [Anaeromyxobacter sp.]
MPAPAPAQGSFAFALCATAPLLLAEPVGRPQAPSWRTRLALGQRTVLVSFTVSRDAARLRLEAQHDAPGAWAIGLDVWHRPICSAIIQSDSPERLHWALTPRAHADPREFFGYALRWMTRKLAGETLVRARLRAVAAGVLPVLHRAAAACAAVLDPAARRVALGFGAPVRTRVAGALAQAPRGWLAQAAAAHPGLVLFGLALLEAEETQEAGSRLLSDLAEGRRLAAALDAAVTGWSEALPVWARQDELHHGSIRGAFAAASEQGREGAARLLSAQKLLIRRTGPWCSLGTLLVPPPSRFAPEDVPASPRANAAWFRVMKVPGVTVNGHPRAPDPRLQEAFGAFASRHALALSRPPRGITLEAWLSAIVEAVRGTGRVPTRATDPARLVALVDVEAVRRAAAAPVRFIPEPGPPQPAAAAAPRPPPGTISEQRFPPWSSERASVVQLTTVQELRLEGARMHSCVATYAPRVERGDLIVFSARVDGKPLTIAIVRVMRGWRLSEWAGFANRGLTRTEREALRPWLEASGIVAVRPRG